MTSFRLVLGTRVSALMGVAEPKRLQDTAPSSNSSAAAIHPAAAPTLFSHFPTSSPTTCIVTVIVKPIIAKTMK